MENEMKFTVYTAEQLAKVHDLLKLFSSQISEQIEHVEIIKPFGKEIMQCNINIKSESPSTVFLPKDPLSVADLGDHVIIRYKEFSFKVSYGNTAKKISYVFVECMGLEKFKM